MWCADIEECLSALGALAEEMSRWQRERGGCGDRWKEKMGMRRRGGRRERRREGGREGGEGGEGGREGGREREREEFLLF